ncbi:MAG: hydrogenase formation protein HypD [Candidatus Omnitrophica bacterium]|nr:hydrogenase formation protein HypD [Candidatus Omnitrophota bacterium]MDD5592541.1 hydrogenase formation protein HypD [Candidatus Omnitrophota bacterium]
MRYVDEFRDIGLINKISQRINSIMPRQNINIMEVCGTHTQNFFRFGLDKLLPDNLKLISGPGCPVCVSPQEYIDRAIQLAQDKDNLILTFGDMLRVPGTKSSLEKERAKNGNVRIVYSALDSLTVARQSPLKKVIFLAVGFETTAPTIALSLLSAKKQNLKNLFFLSSLKLIPPAMDYLARDKRLKLSGFLCPGHVSCIIGTQAYEFILKKYKIGCCITGFEPLDILEGIYFLIQQFLRHKPCLKNQYTRAVSPQGNPAAKKVISRVFKVSSASWRGLGKIPDSGLKIKDEFSLFDAEKNFSFNDQRPTTNDQRPKCRCGDVLKGLISPQVCPLFSKACCPEHPIGPCMVSNEGACSAYYKYRK